MDLSWIFEGTDPLARPAVTRVAETADLSYQKPETEAFRKGRPALVREPMADSALADDAGGMLERAVSHLEGDRKVIDALTLIVNELNDRNEEYHAGHPRPGEAPAKPADCGDPRTLPLRDGSARIEEGSQETEVFGKARVAGSSVVKVLGRMIGGDGVFLSTDKGDFFVPDHVQIGDVVGKSVDLDWAEGADGTRTVFSALVMPRARGEFQMASRDGGERRGIAPVGRRIDPEPPVAGVLKDLALKERARKEGMSEGEIASADGAIDRVFGNAARPAGSIRKMF